MKALIVKRYKKYHKGDFISVSEGFFSNFLFPQGIAVKASEQNIALIEKNAEEIAKEKKELAQQYQKAAELIKDKSIEAKVAANDQTLYASIRPSDILSLVQEQLGVELEEHLIQLPYVIKELGEHSITVQFSTDLSAKLLLKLSAE